MPHFEQGALEVLARRGDAIPLAVGGLPCPESIFSIHCVTEIVRRTRDEVKVVPLSTGKDFEQLAEATSDKPMVPFFDTPDAHAREALLAMGTPIIVVLGDFAETAHFCMVARDLDALQAARFVSQSFSCLEPLQRLGNVRSITLDKAANLAGWIDEVATWLGLTPPEWQEARKQMLAEYAAWPTVEAAIHALVQSAHAASDGWERVPAPTRSLFETLGRSYHSGSIDAVFWPAECILEPGDPATAASGAIQLTGPARVLTFGPFLHLPPGRWRARYQFETDDHSAGNLVEFDITHGGDVLVSRRTPFERAGKYGFDCEFDMEEPRLPVENRAILAEGSIGGFFKPIGIWLNRDQ